MKCLLLLIAVVALTNAVTFKSVLIEEWKSFKMMYSKSYANSAEESSRKQLFMENRYFIAKHNQKYGNLEVSYKMEINEFSDMWSFEFLGIMTSNVYNNLTTTEIFGLHGESASTFIYADNVDIPSAVDWRTQGAVTPVKNQGICGSCWAFSATGSLEGQYFRKNNKLVSLSEQNLIDCSKEHGNNGCEGGFSNLGFDYIKENGGIETEESYPYYRTDEQECKFNEKSIAATCTGYMSIKTGDEENLKNAVATIGPIAVAIQVTSSFVFYRSGVYYEPGCDPSKLNHAGLVVGYGNERGQDYWLVKNSWGENWGQDGYIKMARNKGNNCGIVSAASYPLV